MSSDMEELLVASSASETSDRGKPRRPIGLRHAYRAEQERTLCGLTVRYLFLVEGAKWSIKMPQRCASCDASATTQPNES
jgi:hypothetical protein